VADQFKRAGLQVAEEFFIFRTFTLRSAEIEVEKRVAPVLQLGFDPYAGAKEIQGITAVVEPASNDSGGAYANLGLEGIKRRASIHCCCNGREQ
jgi:hypothetical protein